MQNQKRPGILLARGAVLLSCEMFTWVVAKWKHRGVMLVPCQGRAGLLRASKCPGDLRTSAAGTCCWRPHAGDHTFSGDIRSHFSLTTPTLLLRTVPTKVRFMYFAEDYKAKLFLLMCSSHEQKGCEVFFFPILGILKLVFKFVYFLLGYALS